MLFRSSKPDNGFRGTRVMEAILRSRGFQRIAELPLYGMDPLVRRAAPLQQTQDADVACVCLAPADAKKLGVEDNDKLTVKYNGVRIVLPVKLDASVHAGDVFLPAGLAATAGFAPWHAAVELEKA